MRQYNNILVIQTAFIGDAIIASSLIERLHHELRPDKISVLVRKGNESIYEHHPYLNEVLVWDKKDGKFRNLFRLLKAVRKRKFDCVINCHRYTSSGILAGFSKASHIAGYKQNPFSFLFNFTVKHRIGDGRHEADRYNELVSDFLPGPASRPRLYPSAEQYAQVAKFQDKPYVCMAPASVWFTKQMPESKWIELIRSHHSAQQVYLLGGPDDAELCKRIAASAGNNVNVLAGKLSLLASAALMAKAEMNYVNDSAPLHLASSMNAPVTAFFCSTVPEFGFGPLSAKSRVIQVNGLTCKPCGIRGYDACPLGHFKCAMEIDIANLNAAPFSGTI